MALEMHASLAVHVGDWLKTEIVEPAGISVKALAAHFGVARQTLSSSVPVSSIAGLLPRSCDARRLTKPHDGPVRVVQRQAHV